MERGELRELLEKVASGEACVDDAMAALRAAPFRDLGFAKIDNHRALRTGMAEVIYGAGKTPHQIADITAAMRADGQHTILITRMSREAAELVSKTMPLSWHEIGKVGIVGETPRPNGRGKILIAAAGTSDMSVAEEAAFTAEAFGNEVSRLYDVGVAGLHRLLAHIDDIMGASVIIVIAGMDAALASVIGGLADCPVIAVPTSVGYGAAFGGISALLAMLNSCASRITVVNIDNGFGAACAASVINHIGVMRQ